MSIFDWADTITETPSAAPLPAAEGLTPDGTVLASSGCTGAVGTNTQVQPAGLGQLSSPAVPAAPVLSFIAHGTPGPQGSKSGRVAPNGVDVIMRESSKKVAPWRKAVREAAQRALPPGWVLLDEPIELVMVFTLHKGSSIPKRRRHPAVYPDLSKLARSTEDALTGVVWKDDSRIVRYRELAKRYPLEGPNALNFPGVVVRIYTISAT